jgi:hypothetical protein
MASFPDMEKIWYTVVEPNTRAIQFYNPVLDQTATYYNLPANAIIERQGPSIRRKRRLPQIDPSRPVLTPKTNAQLEENWKHMRPIIYMNQPSTRKNKKRNEERALMEEQEAASRQLRNNERLEDSTANLHEMISEAVRPPELSKYYKDRRQIILNFSKAINRRYQKGGCGCGFGGKRRTRRHSKRSSKRSTRHKASKRSTRRH